MHSLEQLNGADPVVGDGPEVEASNEEQDSVAATFNGERTAGATAHPTAANTPTAEPTEPSGRGHWTYRVASPPDRQMEFVEPYSFWTTSNNAPSNPFPQDPAANHNVQVRNTTRAYWGEPWIICPDIRKQAHADDRQTKKVPDISPPVLGSTRMESM